MSPVTVASQLDGARDTFVIHPFRVSVSSSLMGTVPSLEDMPDAFPPVPLLTRLTLRWRRSRQDQNEIKANEVVGEPNWRGELE